MSLYFHVCSGTCMAAFNMAFNDSVISLHKNRLIVLTMLNGPMETAIPADGANTVSLRQYFKLYKYIGFDEDGWLQGCQLFDIVGRREFAQSRPKSRAHFASSVTGGLCSVDEARGFF